MFVTNTNRPLADPTSVRICGGGKAADASFPAVRKQSMVLLCLAGLLAIVASPGWSAVSPVASRAETQAPHWLERALPEAGPGLEELRQGIQKFHENDYQAALASFNEARQLGAGSRVQAAAVFFAAESRARLAVGTQEVQAAILVLEETRRRYPNSPRALWALWRIGSLYWRQGLDQEAIARFDQLIEQGAAGNPLLPFIRLDLADLYIAQGRYASAAKMLRVVRQYPPDLESLGQATIGLGDIAHAQGQYRQARDFYEVGESQGPKLLQGRPLSLFKMGDTYLRLGNWPRALHFLNTGYTIYPHDPVAPLMLVRMADGLRLGGRIQQAKTLYQTVVERHPETEGELSALLGLAELAEKEAVGAADEAEVQNTYGAILKRWSANPRAAEALLHLAQSYQRAGLVEEAAAAYDKLLRRGDSGPWRAQARQGLETTLQGLSAAGNIVEVANLFLQHRALLTVPAVDGRTGLLVAGALTQLGLIDSAITLLRASLSAGVPKVQQEYGLKALADAYRKKGDLIHLEQSWKEYLRKYPQGAWRAEARIGLLIGLSRPGQQKEAEKTCQTYLHEKAAIGSNEVANQDLVLLCADRFAQDGRLEAAQPLYREILKKESASAQGLWAAYQIARASQAANRPAEAMDYFVRVSKTDKDSLLAAAASAHLATPMASKSR